MNEKLSYRDILQQTEGHLSHRRERPDVGARPETGSPAVDGIAIGRAVVWASDPASWAYELNYRFWVVPISMVVMLVCAFDAWRTRTDRTMMLQQRQPVVIAVGAVFLIVLSIQSLVWNQLTNRLLAETKDGGCIPHVNLGWTYQTPFEHWSLASYMIVLQGQTPRTLILDRNGCNAYDLDGTVHIIWLTRHSGEGWFDLDKVPANILPP